MTREKRNAFGLPVGSTPDWRFWFWTGLMLGVVIVTSKLVAEAMQ